MRTFKIYCLSNFQVQYIDNCSQHTVGLLPGLRAQAEFPMVIAGIFFCTFELYLPQIYYKFKLNFKINVKWICGRAQIPKTSLPQFRVPPKWLWLWKGGSGSVYWNSGESAERLEMFPVFWYLSSEFHSIDTMRAVWSICGQAGSPSCRNHPSLWAGFHRHASYCIPTNVLCFLISTSHTNLNRSWNRR